MIIERSDKTGKIVDRSEEIVLDPEKFGSKDKYRYRFKTKLEKGSRITLVRRSSKYSTKSILISNVFN